MEGKDAYIEEHNKKLEGQDAQIEEKKAEIEGQSAQVEGKYAQLKGPKVEIEGQSAQIKKKEMKGEAQITGQPPQSEATSPQNDQKSIIEFQQTTAQPNLSSYYQFIEGGRLIPEKFSIPLFYELERQMGHTHERMQIAKARNVEYVGIMEEKLSEMGIELANVRLREVVLK